MRKILFLLSSAIISINSLHATDRNPLDEMKGAYAPAKAKRYAFNDLNSAESFLFKGHVCKPFVEEGKTPQEALQAFRDQLPVKTAAITAYKCGGLTLSESPHNILSEGQIIGFKATYQYDGRIPYTVTYKKYQLSVALSLSPEDLLKVNNLGSRTSQFVSSQAIPVPAMTSDPIDAPSSTASTSSSSTSSSSPMPIPSAPPAPALPADLFGSSVPTSASNGGQSLQAALSMKMDLKKVVTVEGKTPPKGKDLKDVLEDAFKGRHDTLEGENEDQDESWSDSE